MDTIISLLVTTFSFVSIYGLVQIFRKKKIFAKRLPAESDDWIKKGIINSSQQDQLLALYSKDHKDMKKLVPIIMSGLGAVLLGVGLFLFYSANWKYMPAEAKIAQVFALMISFYTAGFVLLNRSEYRMLGRVFMTLGMISYGLAIALIAQIFHITAHGGTGTFLWFLGTLAISWIMNERWGFYIASVLLLIWTFQCFTHFNTPNYTMPVFAGLLIWRFYRISGKTGIILVFFELLYWLFSLNAHYLPKTISGDLVFRILPLVLFPLGVCILSWSLTWLNRKEAGPFPSVAKGTGWLLILAPFMLLSWPLGTVKPVSQILVTEFGFYHGQFLLFLISAGILIFLRFKKNESYQFLLALLSIGALLYVLPLGNQTVLVLATHLGLVTYLGIVLFNAVRSEQAIDRAIATACFSIALLIKSVGFFLHGLKSSNYFVAYGIGIVIFSIVLFLLMQVIETYRDRTVSSRSGTLMTALTGGVTFLAVYALSFEVKPQDSIFESDPIVVITLGLFVAMAITFFIFLYLKSTERILVWLAGTVFITSLFVLIISGPVISWIAYSAIFNLLLFIIVAVCISYGIQRNSKAAVNAAIAGFILHVVTRYFDLLFDLLSGSLLFISTGILVLLGGYLLERRRRLWIQEIQDREAIENI